MENLKIHVRRQPTSLNCDIFIVSTTKARVRTFITFDVTGKMKLNSFTSDSIGSEEVIRPAFTVEEYVWREMLKAFQSIASEEGFTKSSESHAVGKLSATEHHLADLRQLLKLK